MQSKSPSTHPVSRASPSNVCTPAPRASLFFCRYEKASGDFSTHQTSASGRSSAIVTARQPLPPHSSRIRGTGGILHSFQHLFSQNLGFRTWNQHPFSYNKRTSVKLPAAQQILQRSAFFPATKQRGNLCALLFIQWGLFFPAEYRCVKR